MCKLKDMPEIELVSYFSSIAEIIESTLPAGSSPSGRALFVLLVFDDPKMIYYVSNANRENMVKVLREAADRIESRNSTKR